MFHSVSKTSFSRVVATWQYLPIIILIVVTTMCSSASSDQYLEQRRRILNLEERQFTGGDVILTENEKKVDDVLLQLKHEELDVARVNSTAFLPSQNFLVSRKDIENSKVFKLIRKIPKGGSLHTHILAAVSADYIIKNISYQENIYGCYINNIFKLKVLGNPKQDPSCPWKSLKAYRKEFEEKNEDFDKFLKSNLTLDVESLNQTKEEVWTKFKNSFSTIYDLVSYLPIFKKFVYRMLEELREDNVFYVELRGTFMPLYELNGTVHDTRMFFATFIETVEEFKRKFPDFVGVKYIHSIYRGVDNETLRRGVEDLIYYKSLYPDFIAGLDLVGNEEEGKDLVQFHEELLGISKDVKFFFHAGETNQFGRTDLNLADAILLNSSRIGHGFALAKHPQLLELARQRDIAIELNPISNQVLKLNDDPRNHPGAVILSKGYPVVICNDDPSTWEASGLSYDWYVVFMAMTWENQGLGVLKQFAQNSITYSAMNESEKRGALKNWEMQWTKFVNRILKGE